MLISFAILFKRCRWWYHKKISIIVDKIYYHTTIICFIVLLMDVEKKIKIVLAMLLYG